jgi:diphthine synthase
MIVAGTFKELLDIDFGGPLHSVVIPGKMHFLEAEFLRLYCVNPVTFDQFADVSEH